MARALTDTTKDRLAKFAEVPKKKSRMRAPKLEPDLEVMTTRIPRDLMTDVRVYCARNRIAVQYVIREALESWLKARQ